MPGRAAQNGAARAGPPTRKAVESASATAASEVTTLALRTPSAGQPVRGSSTWPKRRPPASKCCSPEALVPSAASRRRRRPRSSPPGRRASSQLSPPQPRWLLPPAVRSARADAAHPQGGGDPVERPALPHRPEVELDAGRGEAHRAAEVVERDLVHAGAGPGRRDLLLRRAAAGAGRGTPSTRESAVLAGSKAPPVARVQLAAEREEGEEAGARPAPGRSRPAGSGRDTSLVSRKTVSEASIASTSSRAARAAST